jgi:uncharacterized protein GlcG (DUF336 family)
MKKSTQIKLALLAGLAASSISINAHANCANLPNHAQLRAALIAASAADASGLNLDMWATIVDRDGIVCAVAHTGADRGAQWPGSRVISAQKANAANAFSLDGLAISTAELYGPVQGTSAANADTKLGGSLYGLQHSNPVNPDAAYGGNVALIGTANDPMTRKKIGGVNVFGGGLALYNAQGKVIGGLGLSGDTSCADHNQAWLTRKNLSLDYVSNGPAAAFYGDTTHPDNMIIDNFNGNNNAVTDGFEQPICFNATDPRLLPPVRTVNPQ